MFGLDCTSWLQYEAIGQIHFFKKQYQSAATRGELDHNGENVPFMSLSTGCD